MSINFKSNNCIGIKVGDLKKAQKFYGNVMGFKQINGDDKLISFDTGQFILYVEKSDSNQSPVPSFSVSNADVTKEYLINYGCEIIWETNGCFWFKDPFGNIFDVIET
ncbi:MAG TPA: bleomycin resistance protein [Ignavibacteria bacterium]|nr:bleomycin resistance protein [Ignavibacteria bacterium]